MSGNGSFWWIDVKADTSLLLQGQHNPKGKHMVLRFKATQPMMAVGNGANASATVAMVILSGKRQAVLHSNFTGTGVFDFGHQSN